MLSKFAVYGILDGYDLLRRLGKYLPRERGICALKKNENKNNINNNKRNFSQTIRMEKITSRTVTTWPRQSTCKFL